MIECVNQRLAQPLTVGSARQYHLEVDGANCHGLPFAEKIMQNRTPVLCALAMVSARIPRSYYTHVQTSRGGVAGRADGPSLTWTPLPEGETDLQGHLCPFARAVVFGPSVYGGLHVGGAISVHYPPPAAAPPPEAVGPRRAVDRGTGVLPPLDRAKARP